MIRVRIIRKLFVISVMLAPLFTVTDCRKQPDCGCDGDVVETLNREQATVYFNETGTVIYFYKLGNPYYTYTFCNPGAMFSKLSDAKSGDVLLVTGEAYWDCNFLYQSSNYSYYSSVYRQYQVQVKDVINDLYGKGKEQPKE